METSPSERQSIRVLIADDHPLVRVGVRESLAGQEVFRVVGEAADGGTMLNLSAGLRPDIVLLDLEMPLGPASDLIEKLSLVSPESRVLILSSHSERQYLAQVVNSKIAGFVLKSEAPECLHQALRVVQEGETWYSRGVFEILRELTLAARLSEPLSLSRREAQALELMRRGMDNRKIAEEMGVSKQTVRRYATIIYDKLGVKNRIQAVVGP